MKKYSSQICISSMSNLIFNFAVVNLIHKGFFCCWTFSLIQIDIDMILLTNIANFFRSCTNLQFVHINLIEYIFFQNFFRQNFVYALLNNRFPAL